MSPQYRMFRWTAARVNGVLSDANVVRACDNDALGSLERMLVGALGPAALMEW